MAPCPDPRALGALGYRSVIKELGIDKRNIALIGLGRLILQGKHARCTRKAHHDRADLLGEHIDVTRKLLGHVQEGNDNGNTEGHTRKREVLRPGCQEDAADRGDHGVQDVTDIGNDRAEDVGIAVRVGAGVAKPLVDLGKIVVAFLLMAEHLDDLLPVHHLLEKALGLGNRLLLCNKEARRATADLFGNKEHGHYPEEHHKRHRDTVIDHNEEDGQDNGAGLQKRRERARHQFTQGIHVVGIAAHDLAVLVGVKVAERERLHLFKHRGAKLVQKALRDIGHQLVVKRNGNDRNEVKPRKDQNRRQKLLHRARNVTACLPDVNERKDLLHKDRGDRGNRGRKEDTGGGQRDKRGIGAVQGAQDAEHRALRRLGRPFHFGGSTDRFRMLLHLTHHPYPPSAHGKAHGNAPSFPSAPRVCRVRRSRRFPA